MWKGGQGFAFLNLDIRQHSDLEVIAQRLSGITLKDVELNVQTDQVVRPRVKDVQQVQNLVETSD